MRRNKISKYSSFSVVIIFFIIYFLPSNFLEKYEFPLDLILFIFSFLLIIFEKVIRKNKISYYHFTFILIVVILALFQRSIRSIHLISIVSLDLLLEDKNQIKTTINKFYLIEISLFMTCVYTMIYFGQGNRYVFTAIGEINQSGYALIVLFILTIKKYKKIGLILLFVGTLTFSRSYLLGLLIYIISSNFSHERLKKLNKLFTFKRLTLLSVASLIFLSNLFIYKFKVGLISDSSFGFRRFINIFDYSNFLRFTTNTNLLIFYKEYPYKLLEGLNTYQFFKANKIAAYQQNIPYRNIKPHNFFFSYLQIYGLFSIIIFKYIGKIFNKTVNSFNYSAFLVVFSYLTFLGIGANRYWLYLTIFMLIYIGDE